MNNQQFLSFGVDRVGQPATMTTLSGNSVMLQRAVTSGHRTPTQTPSVATCQFGKAGDISVSSKTGKSPVPKKSPKRIKNGNPGKARIEKMNRSNQNVQV